MKLLHIDSSILGEASVSRQLSAAVVARYGQKFPEVEVLSRDVVADPLPHLDAAAFQVLGKDSAGGDAEVLAEFLAADVIVLGVPMYNFSIPSQLRSWIDRLVVAGKTFAYGPEGAKGLCGNKSLVLAVSRGGVYSEGSPAAGFEHQVTYLKAVFGFMGIVDVTVVVAEGLALHGGADRTRILEEAEGVIAGL